LGPSKANKFESVIFIDLDGTIIRGPFEPAVFPVVFAELAQKSGLAHHEIRRLVIQENLDRQQDPNVSAAQAMDWDDIFDTVATRLGVRLQASAVQIANAHAGPPYSAVLDNADQVLKQLANPHRALVVATKGLRKYQLPVLGALGLAPLFTDILTPDVNRALKNRLAFYGDWPRAARLKISVGDHFEDDVVPPCQFEFKTVWKCNASDDALNHLDPFERPASFDYAEGQTVRPDAIIVSLSELPYVVEELEKEKA
jgi:FMN phosphatase YigB (HAD superfamily)